MTLFESRSEAVNDEGVNTLCFVYACKEFGSLGMGICRMEVSGIVTNCNICCCLFVVCLAPIECRLPLVGIEQYQSCAFVIVHFGHFCVDAPEVGYGDVAMASTALCLTLVTRGAENHVAKESPHEMVLLMMAAKGD